MTLRYVATVLAAIVGIALSLSIQSLAAIACAVAWPFGRSARVWAWAGEVHARSLIAWERMAVPREGTVKP